MINKVIVFLLLTIFICSSSRIVTNISAESDTTTTAVSSIVTPNQTVAFTIKRFREKISLTWLGFFNQKGLGSYSVQLVKERADELVYIAEHDKAQYLETAVSRFITQTGLLSEQFDAKNVEAPDITNLLQGYPEKFSKLRDAYPSQTAQWLLMQQVVDTTQVLASKVQEKK